MLVDGSEGVTVNGNTLTEGGIEFMSGSDHTAAENSIEETGGFGLSARPGISFVGVECGLARGNQVSDTVQAGIVVSGGHDIDVIGNDVRDSELSNISVQGGAVPRSSRRTRPVAAFSASTPTTTRSRSFARTPRSRP